MQDPQADVSAEVTALKAKHEADIAKLRRNFDSIRTSYAVQVFGKRFSQFMENFRLKLPAKPFEEFVSKCRTQGGEEATEYLADLEAENYREIYESLFAMEMDYARAFNHAKLRTAFTFDKGLSELEMAQKRGITIETMKSNEYRINREFFDKFLPNEFIPQRDLSIVEVGAAWGGATHYFVDRFKPTDYHVYEIDNAWCDWLKETFGVTPKSCDGETLSETASDSMDIALCSSAFYFMPMEKQWSYMIEMARVLRAGGLAIFNARVVDRLSTAWLQDYLIRNFPKRNFGLVAQHCLDTAFPQSQFDCISNNPTANRGYVIYKRGT